jgi:hypothetical protein
MYQLFARHPEHGRRFGNAMKAFTEGTGFDLQIVVDQYPWGDLKDGLVVDVLLFYTLPPSGLTYEIHVQVGGSHGFACTRLASAFPSLKIHRARHPLHRRHRRRDRPPLPRHPNLLHGPTIFLTEQPVK